MSGTTGELQILVNFLSKAGVKRSVSDAKITHLQPGLR